MFPKTLYKISGSRAPVAGLGDTNYVAARFLEGLGLTPSHHHLATVWFRICSVGPVIKLVERGQVEAEDQRTVAK